MHAVVCRVFSRAMDKPTREQALALLTTHIKSESLIAHALSVEAVMRHYADKLGEDPDKWGVIGLVHDLDWEQYPQQHCQKTTELLREAGWPEDYIRAVRSHAWGIFTDDQPQHPMEKVLFTIDELTGLVTATALVRPSKSVLDMKSKSVVKKWKQPSFAAGVDRSIVEKGLGLMGAELTEVIGEVLSAMQAVAGEIGLAGDAAGEAN